MLKKLFIFLRVQEMRGMLSINVLVWRTSGVMWIVILELTQAPVPIFSTFLLRGALSIVIAAWQIMISLLAVLIFFSQTNASFMIAKLLQLQFVLDKKNTDSHD